MGAVRLGNQSQCHKSLLERIFCDFENECDLGLRERDEAPEDKFHLKGRGHCHGGCKGGDFYILH